MANTEEWILSIEQYNTSRTAGGNPKPTMESVNYTTLLKDGFTMHWTLLTKESCAKCIHSGGRCGRSNEKDFVCYGSDGSSSEDCDAGVGIGGLVGALCLFIYMIYLRRKYASLKFHLKNITPCPSPGPDMEESSVYFEVPIFTSSELEEATNNFSSSNELGDGGFGTVYYGKLQDGREVAVKRLYEHSYRRVKQFMNEVEILTCLRHKNLVSLYGCTSRHSRELLLVYEYISNGTVADHIHSQRANFISYTAMANPFGVVLVELISSKPAVDISRERHEISLAKFAVNKIRTSALGKLIDPALGFESDSEIHRMTTSVAELAFRCLQQDKEMRPSMNEILKELNAIARYENAVNKSVDADEGEDTLASSPMNNDEVQLSKNMQLTHSPVSVTQKWASSSSSCSALVADV
ncbi:hypothetical protein NL676_032056 [Syzygium grande]|nr:hypothetical protein NL676_032056 [Syzygium grande]